METAARGELAEEVGDDPANCARVLVGADRFVEELRADLARAGRTVLAQFSTFEGDSAGTAFADLLLERASAGVEVRLVIDGYSSVVADDVYPFAIRGRGARRIERDRTSALLHHLDASGVALRRVAPPGRFARYLLFRDHKKLVVVDDRIAYVGGINISEHNYGWHDFMVRLDAPDVVADLVRDFEGTWTGRSVSLVASHPARDYVLNQSAGRATVLDEAVKLVDGAIERVVVESPYLRGDRIERALLRAADRGVRVTVIGPARPNHLHNRVWSRAQRRRLRHPRITCLGFAGTDGMTHAKLLVVDDRVATFGSTNFQEIEALTQKELNVFTRDPAIVAELCDLADADAARSIVLPVPRLAPGAWTYPIAHRLVGAWTRRLLHRDDWRARYC